MIDWWCFCDWWSYSSSLTYIAKPLWLLCSFQGQEQSVCKIETLDKQIICNLSSWTLCKFILMIFVKFQYRLLLHIERIGHQLPMSKAGLLETNWSQMGSVGPLLIMSSLFYLIYLFLKHIIWLVPKHLLLKIYSFSRLLLAKGQNGGPCMMNKGKNHPQMIDRCSCGSQSTAGCFYFVYWGGLHVRQQEPWWGHWWKLLEWSWILQEH